MSPTATLYRKSANSWDDELEIQALYQAGFDLIFSRSKLAELPINSLIIPRYSAWPFYSDLVEDIKFFGFKPINDTQQFNYVADLKEYVVDLKELTPKTWDNFLDVPDNIPLVLKGQTNSKKGYWNELMFAENKKRAIEIHSHLIRDSLIGEQEIYIREYVSLKNYGIGIGGIPISHEFRYFVGFGKILAGGFYWSSHIEDCKIDPLELEPCPTSFLEEIISRVGIKNNFYVIDVAKTVEGNWIVIELNAGEQSGLSSINPIILYNNLKQVINCQTI